LEQRPADKSCWPAFFAQSIPLRELADSWPSLCSNASLIRPKTC
jgi:hypothetical protein